MQKTIPKERTGDPGAAPGTSAGHPSGRTGWLNLPQGVPAGTYFASLIGPILLSAVLGVQLVLAGVLFVPVPPADTSDLTQWGASFFIRDRDLSVFGVGSALALGLGVVLMWAWNRRVMRRTSSPGSMRVTLAAQIAGAGILSVVFLLVWDAGRSYLRQDLPVPVSFVVLCAALAAATAGAVFMRLPSRRDPAPGADTGAPQPVERAFSVLDLLVPLAIASLVYVPIWRQLAGRFFVDESLFHWDYYTMSPALAYSQGKALGTEIYSMYGVGWPMVFRALGSWLTISYGRMIQVGTIYACVYMVGIYTLLRMLVRRPLVAAAGTMMILLQMFLFMGEVVVWRFPSLTVMRWAFDVWCFIALLVHWRTGKRIWAAAAGVAIGLGLLFSTDTGAYLAMAVALYLGVLFTQRPDSRRHVVDSAVLIGSAFAVLLTGLTIAARGEILSGQFWTGWLQALLEFGGGFAQLPMSTAPNMTTIAGFAVELTFYLSVIGYAVGRLLHGRAAHIHLFNGLLAVYGLLNLMHFVGRSGDFTPYRLWIPMALIAVNLVDARLDAVKKGSKRPLIAGGLALASVATLVGVMPRSVLLEPLASYPGLLVTAARGARPDGLCLFDNPRDLCGMPVRMGESVNHFHLVVDRLEQLKAQGKRVAVVDETGALFYLASGTPSFSRYPRIFVAMYTHEMAKEVQDELLDFNPDYILTRSRTDPPNFDIEDWPYSSFGVAPASPHEQSWESFEKLIGERYQLDSELLPFELFKIKEPG